MAVPLPQTDVANSTAPVSPVEKSSNIKSRQFNANVPTGATGLSGGNAAGMQSPLQQLALLQQMTNSNNNPMSIASELEAQKQENFHLQNQKQQQVRTRTTTNCLNKLFIKQLIVIKLTF